MCPPVSSRSSSSSSEGHRSLGRFRDNGAGQAGLFKKAFYTNYPASSQYVLSAGGASLKVMEDLRAKALTHWAAENVYKVAYNRETLKVDIEGTGRLREAERENRLARGKPCHEFVEEWSKKRPHPQALKFYGTWPDAQKNREVIRI